MCPFAAPPTSKSLVVPSDGEAQGSGGPVARPSSCSSVPGCCRPSLQVPLHILPWPPAIHRASPCARSTSLRAVFCGSATLTVVPCSCFGLLQPLSWCLLLPPGAQLPVWGGLDRDGRVHASARLLSLQPLGAEEGWRRRTAVPRPSRLLFVSRVSKGERGRWCPCGWAWKPLCCRAGAARLFSVSCVQTLAWEAPDSCQKLPCQHGGNTIFDLGIPELPPTT